MYLKNGISTLTMSWLWKNIPLSLSQRKQMGGRRFAFVALDNREKKQGVGIMGEEKSKSKSVRIA